jgi:hypothetical protein
MNHTSDTTAAGNGGNFDPREAAALLDQTRRQARRQFEPAQPWSWPPSARSGSPYADSIPTKARAPRPS